MIKRLKQWFREFSDHVDPPVPRILLLSKDERDAWKLGYAACLKDIKGYDASEEERLVTARRYFEKHYEAADRRALLRPINLDVNDDMMAHLREGGM
jgi:hypothetical protein